MRKYLLLLGASSVLTLPLLHGTAQAGPLRDMMRARMMERMERSDQTAVQTPAPAGSVEIAYGADPLQKLDYWKATRPNAPLIVFVHGGGWKQGDKRNATGQYKAPHYLEQGYAFASLNYRLVPAATVEQQAQDIADALAALERDASRLGFDPARIVLMGHSAGAHLVALAGTDTSYLQKAGLRPDALRGVIALDGACYDVPRQIAEGGQFMHDSYIEAFGTYPARQKALSPITHATAPNAPAFLILHVERQDGTAQSQALATALRRNGTAAELQGLAGKGLQGHMEINRRLGDPAYPATPVVDAWIRKVVG